MASVIVRKKVSKLEKYVGKMVQLRQQAYRRFVCRDHGWPRRQENRFLVAAIDRRMKQLICYGGNYRINVNPDEIVLI